MQVLEQQQARPATAHHAEEADDRLTEHQARIDARLRGRGPCGARPVREQPRECRPIGTERRGRHVEAGPQRPDERLGHGPVGPATFDRTTGKDDMRCRRRSRDLLEQAGFSDARLPGDEHEPAAPLTGLEQRLAQDCHLLVPTHEGSAARGPSCHGHHSRCGGRETRPSPHPIHELRTRAPGRRPGLAARWCEARPRRPGCPTSSPWCVPSVSGAGSWHPWPSHGSRRGHRGAAHGTADTAAGHPGGRVCSNERASDKCVNPPTARPPG